MPLARTGTNLFADLIYTWRLLRQLRSLKPDAVLAYTHKPCVYGMIAARVACIPSRCALITGLGYPFMPEPGFIRAALRAVMRGLYNVSAHSTTAFVFQNSDDLEYFRKCGILHPEHHVALVGGSGVPLDEFEARAMPSACNLLMLSRLLVSKGVGQYIDAARIVSNQFPSVELLLAGAPDSGPDGIGASYREILDTGRWVKYIGRVLDVRPEITRSAAVVLPSYYREGVPRSLIEALACGRPVITTNMPGCRETLLPGVLASGDGWERRPNGYVVEPRSAHALAAAIVDFLRLSSADREEMGRQSRGLAEQNFDVTRVNRAIEGALVRQ